MIMVNQSVHQKFAIICILKPLKYCSLSFLKHSFQFFVFQFSFHNNIDIKNNDNHEESFYSMLNLVISSFESFCENHKYYESNSFKFKIKEKLIQFSHENEQTSITIFYFSKNKKRTRIFKNIKKM